MSKTENESVVHALYFFLDNENGALYLLKKNSEQLREIFSVFSFN